MKKIICALFGIMVLSTIAFAEAPKVPDSVVIDHFAKKKGAVTLDHKKHNTELKIKCETCHHHKKEGETKEQTACSDAECHSKVQEKDGKKIDATKSSKKVNPYHIRCRGCHDNLPEEFKDKKPAKKCKDCHAKKKKVK